MNSDLLERLETRAHHVTGAEPWERNDHDPRVATSVNNAKAFLEKIGSALREPSITGGTTANPGTIVTVYWIVQNINKIFGVYVSFKDDDTCRLEVSGPGMSSFAVDNLSLDELLNYDVPYQFHKIESKARQAGGDLHKPGLS
ncbi:hypothetical protein [Methylobacterium sp. yr668]|uniref:hypothetical protein n=1 Tax=Methylobacterium sp. yr668 TaxID=1761801 RepID=UPI0008E19E93|nr:hypothetical protein [Methylobacterium sp. yr668]SFT26604.1 hypothetical protein SAMN04487845_13612 [Methylobacterium sp. yr668]